MLITAIILSLLLIISVIINFFQYKALIITLKKVEIFENWVILYSNSVIDTYNKLKEVDDRQLFEKDDDVGFIFTNLLTIIEHLKKTILYEEISEKEESPIQKQETISKISLHS